MGIKFLIKNTLHSLTVAAILFGIISFTNIAVLVPTTWYLLLFFYVVTSVSQWLVIKVVKERPALFIRNFMMGTVLKFFLYLALLAFYVVNNPEDAKAFAITFIILYFTHLIYEVYNLMKLAKDNAAK